MNWIKVGHLVLNVSHFVAFCIKSEEPNVIVAMTNKENCVFVCGTAEKALDLLAALYEQISKRSDSTPTAPQEQPKAKPEQNVWPKPCALRTKEEADAHIRKHAYWWLLKGVHEQDNARESAKALLFGSDIRKKNRLPWTILPQATLPDGWVLESE